MLGLSAAGAIMGLNARHPQPEGNNMTDIRSLDNDIDPGGCC